MRPLFPKSRHAQRPERQGGFMSTRPACRTFGAPSPSTKSEPLKAARETFWSAPARIWRRIVSAA